ncbi:MAG: fatty acid desaturase [Bacteroidia bacterium]
MQETIKLPRQKQGVGIFVAFIVMALWALVLYINLSTSIDWLNPLSYVLIFIQAHLFTGLFITAHDAMHGTVAPERPKLNHIIGKVCATLFLFNSYKTLYPKHHLHHKHAGTQNDPDYHNGHPNFFIWFFDFMKEYISWWQIILAAITFNVISIWVAKENLVLYWIIPSILATMQLFYFGTYLPHRGQHDSNNKHNSRSQKKNHLVAFLTCYFFGYHYEHHDSPATAWWRLWKLR